MTRTEENSSISEFHLSPSIASNSTRRHCVTRTEENSSISEFHLSPSIASNFIQNSIPLLLYFLSFSFSSLIIFFKAKSRVILGHLQCSAITRVLILLVYMCYLCICYILFILFNIPKFKSLLKTSFLNRFSFFD